MPTSIASLYVVRGMRLRRARRLPVAGSVKVNCGAEVSPDDIVACAEMAGPVVRLTLMEALGLSANDNASRYLIKSPGDAVQVGEEIARKKGSFGRGDRICTSPIDGKLDIAPTMPGDILITSPMRQIELQALIPGRVVDILPQRGAIIEGVGDFIQCLVCLGGGTHGTVRLAVNYPNQPLDVDSIDDHCNGSVLIAGSIDEAALRKALFVGVRAAIVGSITAATFRWLRDNPQPVTVMLTEGFGEIPMAQETFDLLAADEGRIACVLSPDEVIGSSPPAVFIPATTDRDAGVNLPECSSGSQVRIVRGPTFGTRARIIEFPQRKHLLDSGVRTEVIRLATQDGREIIVSRNNIELVQ